MLGDSVFIHDLQGKLFYVNRRAWQSVGYNREDLLGMTMMDLNVPEYAEDVRVAFERLKRDGHVAFVSAYRRKDGTTIGVEVNSRLIETLGDKPQDGSRGQPGEELAVSLVREIDKGNNHDHLEERLLASEEKYRSIVELAEEGIWVLNKDGVTTLVNPKMASLLGYAEEEMHGRRLLDFIHEEDKKLARYYLGRSGKNQRERREFVFLRKDGTPLVALVAAAPLKGAGESYSGMIGIVTDITERKKMEKELEKRQEELTALNKQLTDLTIRDPLTGLYNRLYFEASMKRLDNRRNLPISIIMMDVDGLKLINDALGHERGDELLKDVAATIRSVFRAGDVVARIGGDEFAAILPRASKEGAQQVHAWLTRAIQEHNQRNPQRPFSLSIGVSTTSDSKITLSEAFKRADDTMYMQKLANSPIVRHSIIESLRATLGERDHMTEVHANRLKELAGKFGKVAGLSSNDLDLLSALTVLHDIGKVGISDQILFKKGELTPIERETIEKHSEIGYRIARASPELSHIAEYILLHHERWDGTGPQGLAGRKIPLICRILSIVDAYDAMTNDRPYRKALSKEEAARELLRNVGTQFDPKLARLFVSKVLGGVPKK